LLNVSYSFRSVQKTWIDTTSSIANPADSTVCLMSFITSLASSSGLAGGMLVLASRPIWPAMYSVLPKSTPSLNGSALLSAGRGFTMYLRSAAPAAVQSTRNNTLITTLRSLMISSRFAEIYCLLDSQGTTMLGYVEDRVSTTAAQLV